MRTELNQGVIQLASTAELLAWCAGEKTPTFVGVSDVCCKNTGGGGIGVIFPT